MDNFTPEQIEQFLQQFFNVVGRRQYIGARYVPIFGRKDESSIEWDNTKPYEPLTIVTYQGNSYTSRTYVPTGIEITDTAYWANTGNYNAQVEQYRQEVLSYEAAIVKKSFAFDTVTEMKNSDVLYEGAICRTNGFYSKNDGGAAWYVISTSGVANDMDVIACGDLYANLCEDSNIGNCKQYGAAENSDISSIVQYVLNKNTITTAYIPSGEYFIDTPIEIPAYKNISMDGNIKSLLAVNIDVLTANNKVTVIKTSTFDSPIFVVHDNCKINGGLINAYGVSKCITMDITQEIIKSVEITTAIIGNNMPNSCAIYIEANTDSGGGMCFCKFTSAIGNMDTCYLINRPGSAQNPWITFCEFGGFLNNVHRAYLFNTSQRVYANSNGIFSFTLSGGNTWNNDNDAVLVLSGTDIVCDVHVSDIGTAHHQKKSIDFTKCLRCTLHNYKYDREDFIMSPTNITGIVPDWIPKTYDISSGDSVGTLYETRVGNVCFYRFVGTIGTGQTTVNTQYFHVPPHKYFNIETNLFIRILGNNNEILFTNNTGEIKENVDYQFWMLSL